MGCSDDFQYVMPSVPEMEFMRDIQPGHPDKLGTGQGLSQRYQGIDGSAETHLPFDIRNHDLWVAGGYFPAQPEPFLIGHDRCLVLKGILRGDKPPYEIQLQHVQRCEARMQVPLMRGIE